MFIGSCIILIVEQRESSFMSLAFLFHYLMLNMFRILIHPSSGVCDLFVISCVVLLWFDVCWCYGVVRLGWCGIVMQAEACIILCIFVTLFSIDSHIGCYDDWKIMESILGGGGNCEKYM